MGRPVNTPLSYAELTAMSPEAMQARMAQSPVEAARITRSAALHGLPAAMVQWGQMLVDGVGTPRDATAAYRWFSIAAEAGHLDGVNMVGRCHELGWGVPVDHQEAARWYERAAGLGHDWAQFNLGELLLAGVLGVRDEKGALSLFLRSARAGNLKAMNKLGHYREDGWAGVAVKPALALRWYTRAADRGCYRAHANLARLADGRGDREEAARRYSCSIAIAPADFLRDISGVLLDSADPELQALGRRALILTHEETPEAARPRGGLLRAFASLRRR